MSRNLNQVFIHLTWSVKYRNGVINANGMASMRKYIFDHFRDRTYIILCANGHKDHLHVLFKADLNIAISKTVKDIKGATSNWLNNAGLIDESFRWQRGYAAFSVSPQNIDMIKRYIANQQNHHS
jgi:REP element-mobilizing transposase RayT